MIGETIKDFRITERLGKGGMGEVWVAEQQIVKTKVAIKLLFAELSSNQQLVQRFFNEAIAVSKIKHAGIVRIYDVGFHHGSAYLIMELLEGETLASRIRRAGRLPMGQVGEVGRQIASVLEATHAAHITHRDLKPDNIFLVQDAELASGERVKILDFGIAKLGATTGLTGTSGGMGTPGYMAPEQWADAAKADARADVYAVGCIAFEMCCGRPPFVVSSIPEAYTKHVYETPPRARTHAPEVPHELDDMIAAALAKRPPDRPSMKELQRVFATVAAVHPGVMTSTQQVSRDPVTIRTPAAHIEPDTTLRGAASSARVEPRPRRWSLLVIGGVAMLGGGASGYAIMRRGRDPAANVIVEPTPPPVDARVSSRAALPNTWVRITVPTTPVLLGVQSDREPATVHGFRPGRKITSPAASYDLQEHEVTWSEIEPWLASSRTLLEFPPWAAVPDARASLPVTGVTWSIALAYCKSLGGWLPTEEQWEYAARGPERRPNSWGADRLDRSLTHAYAGPTATPAAVKTSMQDQTPAPVLYDLIGNVQEWTAGLWREDTPGTDESWVESGPTSIRAIRGLPLEVEPPQSVQAESAAFREQLCATGPCVEKGAELRRYVGFRCAKAVAR
jgi:serine/threonine-protein kinase